MLLSAIMVFVVEREFLKAPSGRLPPRLSPLSALHAYVLTPAGVQNRFGGGAAKAYAMACLLAALLLVALHY